MNKIVRLTVLMVLCGTATFAQGFEEILKGSKDDANYLAQGYISPLMNAVSTGLNSGWYNTAAPHKTLGFDLTLSISAIYVPSSDQFFTVDNQKMSTLQLVTPSNGQVPTIFGPKQAPTYDFKAPLPSQPFQGPEGIDPSGSYGFNGAPLPIIGLGIGLPKNTELRFRYVPTIGGDTKIGMFGIGVMHDIKQYIPGIKMAPFDMSVFVGYSSLKMDINFDPVNNPDQVGNVTISSTTVQALISKKISVLTLYGGTGFNFNSASIQAKGTYDTGLGTQLVDPVDFSVKSSGPRLTAGLRLKFAIFTLHGDYTFQKYNTLNVGFGFSVR